MPEIIFDNEENRRLYENEAKAMAGAFCTDMAFLSGDTLFCGVDGDTVKARVGSGREVSLTVAVGDTHRRSLKKAIYLALSEHTHKSLPWGCLTGVRPVRLVSRYMAAGMDEKKALESFMDEYLVSSQKAELASEVALRQRHILDRAFPPGSQTAGYCLYVGIPFCPTTCLYCSFTSYPIGANRALVEPYLGALYKEIRSCAAIMEGAPVSVYIGGGTPSSLEPSDIDELLTRLEEAFDIGKAVEITFEAGRPDSITTEKLRVLKKHGVGRISVNPQTMNEKTLALIGRHHTPEDVRNAFRLAAEEGFDDINTDLILGLPGEGEKELAHTLKEVARLSPSSLTIHSLAVKRGSKLHELLTEGAYETAGSGITADETRLVESCVREMGMKPYYLYRQKRISGNFENVGYALEGKYCLYNVVTMEETLSVLALGAGSISKRVYAPGEGTADSGSPGGTAIRRCDNAKDIREYILRIDEMIDRKRTLFA